MIRCTVAALVLAASLLFTPSAARAHVDPACEGDAWSYCYWAYITQALNNCDPNDEECVGWCRDAYYGCMEDRGCYDREEPYNFPL